jgi:hypothetical protein
LEFNYDDKRRCEIIGLEYPVEYCGGCYSFEGLTLDKLNLLLDEGFADPDEQQNSAPDTSEFKSFLEQYPKSEQFMRPLGAPVYPVAIISSFFTMIEP